MSMGKLEHNFFLKYSRKILRTKNFANIKFCNNSFYQFYQKPQKSMLQKGLTSYVIARIIIAKMSKIYKFAKLMSQNLFKILYNSSKFCSTLLLTKYSFEESFKFLIR